MILVVGLELKETPMILKREENAGEVMAAEPHPSLAEDCEKTKKGENITNSPPPLGSWTKQRHISLKISS